MPTKSKVKTTQARPQAQRVRTDTALRGGGHGKGSVARITGMVMGGDPTTRHGREQLRHAGARRIVGHGARRIHGNVPH
jgi:hypothetical protein